MGIFSAAKSDPKHTLKAVKARQQAALRQNQTSAAKQAGRGSRSV